MASRGRQPGFRMSDEHRVKIQNSNILNALIGHACGEREMSSTQVTAGIALLKKVMPDLASMALTGADGGPIQHEDVGARDALLSRIGGVASRVGTNGSTPKPH